MNLEFDIATLDSSGETADYMVNPTNDKIMIKTNSNETRLPTLNRFLSSITGSGLTSDTSGLSINNVQSFLNIESAIS